MKQFFLYIFTLLLLVSCQSSDSISVDTTEQQEMTSNVSIDYSEEFKEYFDKSEITLTSDSIIFPDSSAPIVLIPRLINKNVDILFESPQGHSITVKQVNYTDLEFSIKYNDKEYNGKASLAPQFHLGSESTQFTDGEYYITPYFVTETDNTCLDYIALGNQNIINDSTEMTYAMIAVSGDTCEDELKELTDKKLIQLPTSAKTP